MDGGGGGGRCQESKSANDKLKLWSLIFPENRA